MFTPMAAVNSSSRATANAAPALAVPALNSAAALTSSTSGNAHAPRCTSVCGTPNCTSESRVPFRSTSLAIDATPKTPASRRRASNSNVTVESMTPSPQATKQSDDFTNDTARTEPTRSFDEIVANALQVVRVALGREKERRLHVDIEQALIRSAKDEVLDVQVDVVHPR